MSTSRAVLATTLAAFALAPATAAAGPPASLRTVSAPPPAASAGGAFTLTGKVRNASARTTRMRLTVSLRTARTSKDGRIAAVKYLPKLKSRDS